MRFWLCQWRIVQEALALQNTQNLNRALVGIVDIIGVVWLLARADKSQSVQDVTDAVMAQPQAKKPAKKAAKKAVKKAPKKAVQKRTTK